MNLLLAAGMAFRRLAPLTTSAVLHAGFWLGAVSGHAPQASLSSPAALVSIEVDAARAEDQLAPPTPMPNRAGEVAHAHRHSLPGSGEARLHDASIVHAPLPPVVPAVPLVLQAASPDASQAPRFTMAIARDTQGVPRAAPLPQGSQLGVNAAQGPGTSESQESIVPEADVSTPARLRSAAQVVYPPSARAAELEADVPLEIVVDTSGRVTEAKLLRQAGFGLDEAALDAIRRYSFSPALRNGRAVRVRMRWVVNFRLK